MYLADVIIGSPGQSFRMLIDTGSWIVVVPSAACQQPGCRSHNRFDTRNSTPGNRTAAINFAQGSMAGNIFSDVICAGSRSAHLQEVGFLQRRSVEDSMCARMSFLVADKESPDFADAPFDGILGLGLQGGPDSGFGNGGDRFSFLRQLSAQGRLPRSVFSLRLGNQGSSELSFGRVDDSSLVGGRSLWVPLSSAADGHWQISVSDLTLDGVQQHFGEMEVVVDSGTSLLAPDDGLTMWLRERLTPDDCNSVNSLPKLGFRLPGGGTLTMLPSDYIDRIGGKCSLAVMPLNLPEVAGAATHSAPARLILGDSFLRRFTTSFDLRGRQVGFGIASGGDQAKELAEALFPDVSPESFEKGTSKVQDAMHFFASKGQNSERHPLPEAEGLADHLSAARVPGDHDKSRAPSLSIGHPPLDAPTDSEEQNAADIVAEVNGLAGPLTAARVLRDHGKREAPSPSIGGLVGHLSAARVLRDDGKSDVPSLSIGEDERKAIPLDSPVDIPVDIPAGAEAIPLDNSVDAEEQAGYDFVRHLSGHLSRGSAWTHRKKKQRRMETRAQSAHKDRLKEAGSKLDQMINVLKARDQQREADEDAIQQKATAAKAELETLKAKGTSMSWWHGVSAAADVRVKRMATEEHKGLKRVAKKTKKAAQKRDAQSGKSTAQHGNVTLQRDLNAPQPQVEVQAPEAQASTISWWAEATDQDMTHMKRDLHKQGAELRKNIETRKKEHLRTSLDRMKKKVRLTKRRLKKQVNALKKHIDRRLAKEVNVSEAKVRLAKRDLKKQVNALKKQIERRLATNVSVSEATVQAPEAAEKLPAADVDEEQASVEASLFDSLYEDWANGTAAL